MRRSVTAALASSFAPPAQADVLHLVEVERGRQLPLDAPEAGRQGRHQQHDRGQRRLSRKAAGGSPAVVHSVPTSTTGPWPWCLTPGQPVQLSSPAVLAPARRPPRPSAAPCPTAPRQPLGRRSLGSAFWAGLRRWESSVALLLISTVYSLIQGATQNIIGIDGYYHIKVALLMREQGWRFLAPLDFPWLQLTILGPGRYTDHHFLFHVLQAPFTFGDPRIGAKMAAVLFAVLGLYTTYLFLARFGVRYPLLWIAVAARLCPDLPLAPVDGADPVALGAADRARALGAVRRAAALAVAGRLPGRLAVQRVLLRARRRRSAAVLVSLAYCGARRWWLAAVSEPRLLR